MQYPAGHLAHLSDNQQQKLNEFKQICQEQGYYTPAAGGKDASHDDETMLCTGATCAHVVLYLKKHISSSKTPRTGEKTTS
jgi:hypothetical protein